MLGFDPAALDALLGDRQTADEVGALFRQMKKHLYERMLAIKNAGSDSVFIDGVCGTTLERTTGGTWQMVYSPICRLDARPGDIIEIPAGGQWTFDFVVQATLGAGRTRRGRHPCRASTASRCCCGRPVTFFPRPIV